MQDQGEENGEWAQLPPAPGVEGGEDDFTKFLELGADFSHFDNIDGQHAPSGLDTPMSRLAFGAEGQLQGLMPQQQEMLQHMDLDMNALAGAHVGQIYAPSQTQHNAQYQQYMMYQQMPHQFPSQIPPTPVSADMQGTKYGADLQNVGQILFDRQQASFTPLVSPAQTPLESAWSMPDYVVAEEFFSPLTSPAIEAQHNYHSTNTTSSPVDLNDQDGSGPATRKGRKKLTPASRVASVRNMRPTGKSTERRRQGSITSLPMDKINTMLETPASRLQPRIVNPGMSSEDSVSPEPLSEMRPPPLPQGKTPSRAFRSPASGDSAATPSILMRMPVSQQNDNKDKAPGNTDGLDVMEDISLPAAATDMPPLDLPETNTRIVRDTELDTPTMSIKTPKLTADSTPRSGGVRPSNASAEILPKIGRGGRVSKKRPSVSSAAISPALRPKISPSITPLVPNAGSGMPMISAETSALYLASKSNYQNILDGTHLPGVSYPDTLAENLSSKRTSHKIAEQGRRNRINLALKEIESLLPASITAANKRNAAKEESADAQDKSGGGQGTSKANTVEMAIVYIKDLQNELQETKRKLDAAEKAIAEGTSSGSQTSEQPSSHAGE